MKNEFLRKIENKTLTVGVIGAE